MLNLPIIRWNPNDADEVQRIVTRDTTQQSHIAETVTSIINDVKQRGDAAIDELTRRFDALECGPEGWLVPKDTWLEQPLDSKVKEAIDVAARRITSYHEHMRPSDLDYTDNLGIRMGARWNAMQAAGLYVPGGRALYPSTVLMNAIPAKVAGVETLVMVVPTPNGTPIHPAILYAAHVAGVNAIYRIGGAQAVAALAFGTHTIPKVDIVVGPGNAYVAEAKRQLYGIIGIDMIAGPSEILVVSDNQTPAAWTAADLLSQAEHDPMASAVLVTNDETYAESVKHAIEDILSTLPRATIATQALESHSAIIVTEDLEQAANVVNMLAPEHLELAVEEPDALMKRIRYAGAIFLGRHTPEAMGDYMVGPSHVLPTGGTARFSNGLSVQDFMVRTSFMQLNEDTIQKIGPHAVSLAECEGLGAHGLSVAVRLHHDK